MELSVLKNLPDNKLNRYLDNTADLYIHHAKKRKLILPAETEWAKWHCSANVLGAGWSPPNDPGGTYDMIKKRILMGREYKPAIYNLGGNSAEIALAATTVAIHEVGHTFQNFDSNGTDYASYFLREVLNDWAEAMVSLSHFREGGYDGIVDAKLEFCHADTGSGVNEDDVRRWLGENLNYVLRGKKETVVQDVCYSPLYPDVLRILKTLGISIKDAVRGGTVFGGELNIPEMGKEYNRMFRGRSFKELINNLIDPDAKLKTAHLAPLTMKDCRNFVKEING